MKLILHNSVSLDGSVIGFAPDMGVHYGVVGAYEPDVLLVGSLTARSAISEVPPEIESDFSKPEKQGLLWAIADSGGILKGMLHVLRRSEYCGDIVVLVSERTPKSYLRYLKERRYDHVVAGKGRIDFREALRVLAERYKAKVVVSDSGGILNSVLLRSGLVDEISLLVFPLLVGTSGMPLFRTLGIKDNLGLGLIKNEVLPGGLLHLVYGVRK
jgi:2,5-diamino-6-(ribosylamino)-4(3H)-pyrimidinone 5'-phosphate reductase